MMVRTLARTIDRVSWIQYCSKSYLSRLEVSLTAFFSLTYFVLIVARSPSDVASTLLTSSRSTAFAVVTTSMC